jgi:uncharacterized protein (TIGR03382 family)
MSLQAWSIAALSLALPAVASADIENGSFEAAGYQGWTLSEESASGTFATAGLVKSGDTIQLGSSVYDYTDRMVVPNYSDGLPLQGAPTDGAWQAVLLQNGPAKLRLSQVVTVPLYGQLSFDLAYHNWQGEFSPAQTLQVQLRDVDTNKLIATVFEPTTASSPMSHYTFDIGSFQTQTVRLQLEVVAQRDFLDVQLDNVTLQPVAIHQVDEEPGEGDEVATSAGCSTTGGSSGALAVLALLVLRRRRRA